MIPFIALDEQYKQLKSSIDSRIQKVLDHGKYIMGPEVAELESVLADFVGVKHVIGCSSGTDGLLMALMASEIGPGDAVFTTPFTFISTAEVVSLLGATPVFVDIDPKTYNMDPQLLESTIEKTLKEEKLNPKAIIPVDLFGLPADYDEIKIIAKKYNLKTLEDAAQSFGASYKGKRACSLGDAAVTSFFPAKPMGCYGDGGAVFTNNDGMAVDIRSIRVHGKGSNKYDNIRIGLNGRLDTIQAAVVLAKMAVFEDEINARNKVAEQYTMGFKDQLITPEIPDGSVSVWAQYSVQASSASERASFMNKYKDAGIPTAIYYPKPLHLQQAFSNLGHKEGDFPVSEEVSKRIFSLPMHPYLSTDVVNRVTSI